MASPKLGLADQIAEIPAELQSRARAGFGVASGLDSQKLNAILDRFVSELASGSGDAEIIAEIGGISKSQAAHLITALAVAFGVLSEGSGSAEEFAALAQDQLFDVSDRQVVLAIADTVLKNRDEIRRSMSRIGLARETLPALIDLDISVDLRAKFEQTKIIDAVSVAIVHIDTDARPEIWFQLSRSQLLWIVDRFNEVLRQMEAVEDLYVKRLASEK